MMTSRSEASWLDVAVNKHDVFILRDHGQLERAISEFPDPTNQHPRLSVFLGGKTKDTILRALFPQNNIRRTRSTARFDLRCDNLTVQTPEPHLFIDGEASVLVPHQHRADGRGVRDYPVSWSPNSNQELLWSLYASLVFLFADIVCIFGDDFPGGLLSVARFLVDIIRTRQGASRPNPIRPKVIVVLTGAPDRSGSTVSEIRRFYHELHAIGWEHVTGLFSTVNVIHTDPAPDSVPYNNLRISVQAQLNDAQSLRRTNGYLFTAAHLSGLFNQAIRHSAASPRIPFDFIRATRESNPVPSGIKHHLSHYLDAGIKAGCPLQTLLASMMSALLMDHYLPGTILFEPQSVFRTMYRSDVFWACQRSGPGDPVDGLMDLAETEFVGQFHCAVSEGGSMVDHRQNELMALSSELGRIQSDIICVYCLVRSAQHSQACHHALCDHCAQLFGRPAADAEYRFTLPMCFLCLSTATLVIDVLPPTMNPTILAIDGGGVRGGIPLEYLIMIQEHLGPDCRIQDLADLSVGSSSGGLIVLGLMGMGWDVATCSQVFDRLARRIFHERRRSILSSFSRLLFGRDSLLDGFLRWISWVLHDSCYDAHVFDASLREAFGESRRIFDVVGPNPPSHLHSKSKFAVVATTIAKETKSYVFGNFNGEDWFTREHEHELFRAESTDGEPLLWEVARATAAAPFYFSPASLHTIGSFQDGGLRDNFAAGIAKRVSRRVWPSRTGVARLVSLGTGTVEGPPNHSPHFRHILRDGFLRRGFDALMSNLDTQPKWQELRNQLDDGIKEDYLRLDVPLKGVPCSIDDVDRMDDYRDLVIGQSGSSRMAKETAAALLVSRFYFELDRLPFHRPISGPSWYHGKVRCKGPTGPILSALQKLCVGDIEFVSDSGLLGKFTGPEDACESCGRYAKSISILVNHPTESFNIYMRFSPGQRWRISGFPRSVEAFIETQRLQHPFGRPDHNRPSVVTCPECDGSSITRCHESKRGPATSLSGPARKRARTMDTLFET